MKKYLETGLALQIEQFLRDRRVCTDDEIDVRQCDLDRLPRILDFLLRLKFDKHSDGSLPIQIVVIDRTRFRALEYEPVPCSTVGTVPAVFPALMENLSTAVLAVAKFINNPQNSDAARQALGEKEKTSSQKLLAMLQSFFYDIESTGGVYVKDGAAAGCAASPDWLDLSQSYVVACEALGRKPLIVNRDDSET